MAPLVLKVDHPKRQGERLYDYCFHFYLDLQRQLEKKGTAAKLPARSATFRKLSSAGASRVISLGNSSGSGPRLLDFKGG